MNAVTEWVKNIFIIIVAVSFIEVLVPTGNMEKYVKYIFSLIILADNTGASCKIGGIRNAKLNIF